jgi:hypothetical protein
MSRNLKKVGLVLMAVVTFSAFASAALRQPRTGPWKAKNSPAKPKSQQAATVKKLGTEPTASVVFTSGKRSPDYMHENYFRSSHHF